MSSRTRLLGVCEYEMVCLEGLCCLAGLTQAYTCLPFDMWDRIQRKYHAPSFVFVCERDRDREIGRQRDRDRRVRQREERVRGGKERKRAEREF